METSPSSRPAGGPGPISVVIATRNRCRELLHSLEKHLELPERPHTIVVDNASTDGTPERVTQRFPDVEVIALAENLGAAARTLGAASAPTELVAFSDDDSWWAPGSLSRATALFEAHPSLGLLAARVLVGDARSLEAVCEQMASSPLEQRDGVPGRRILGFVACGAIVRRPAYLEVGGFDPRMGIGGEESLLAIDLAQAGWDLAYVDDVVACHHPSPHRDPVSRRRATTRNDLWFRWLRIRAGRAFAGSLRVAGVAARDPGGRAGLADAVRGLPWALRRRRPVSARLDHELRALGY